MPKRPWAKDEQLEFLTGHLPSYREIQPTKDYTTFWPQLYEGWFLRWPEKRELFPEKPHDELLTNEEELELGSALKARREVNLTHL
jgi:hypothetical protein